MSVPEIQGKKVENGVSDAWRAWPFGRYGIGRPACSAGVAGVAIVIASSCVRMYRSAGSGTPGSNSEMFKDA